MFGEKLEPAPDKGKGWCPNASEAVEVAASDVLSCAAPEPPAIAGGFAFRQCEPGGVLLDRFGRFGRAQRGISLLQPPMPSYRVVLAGCHRFVRVEE